MTDSLRAETVRLTGHGGDEIEAYLAQPLDEGRFGGVVVIHHMPGYDEGMKEITRKFAAHGYLAVCPNLYSREAPGASADDAAAVALRTWRSARRSARWRRARRDPLSQVARGLERSRCHDRLLLRRPAVFPRRMQPSARRSGRLLRRLCRRDSARGGARSR